MSSRKAKKFTNLLLPLTFVIGIAAFPLGSMLLGQVKKSHPALASSPAKHKQKSKHAAAKHGKISRAKHKKIAKGKHKTSRRYNK